MSDASNFVSGVCAHTHRWVSVSVYGPLCTCISACVCCGVPVFCIACICLSRVCASSRVYPSGYM